MININKVKKKSILIVADLFDINFGSEFIVPYKFVQWNAENKQIKFIKILVPRRNDNIEKLKNRFQFLGSKIEVIEYNFIFTKNSLPHKYKILFILDLMIFYIKSNAVIKKFDIDIVHKVNQVNFFFGFLSTLLMRRKIIVGPISGLFYSSLDKLPLKSKCYYFFYNISIFIIRNLFFQTAKLKNTILISATTKDLKILKNKKFDFLFEISELPEILIKFKKINNSTNDITKVLWAGGFIERKRPLLYLQIAKESQFHHLPFEFTMIGSGPLEKDIRRFISNNNLKNINLLTSIPRNKFLKKIPKFDIAIATSMREVNSVFIYESLLADLKVIANNENVNSDWIKNSLNIVDTSNEKDEINEFIKILSGNLHKKDDTLDLVIRNQKKSYMKLLELY